MKLVYLALFVLLISGCSNRGIYEGIKASNRIECSQLPAAQYDECMQDANKSFDEYERERKEATEKGT